MLICSEFRIYLICFLFAVSCGLGTAQENSTPATEVSTEIDSLLKAVNELMGKNDFESAMAVCLKAEEQILNRAGSHSKWFGYVNIRKAYIQMNLGLYKESESTLLETKKLARSNSAWDREIFQDCLILLARMYYFVGEFPNAEKQCLELIEDYKNRGEEELPGYADILGNLALVYQEMGKLDKVEPLYMEAAKVQERTLGKLHHNYGATILNLGFYYFALSDYEKSEKYYLEAKNIFEQGIGKEHPVYASLLNMMATLYRDQGKFDQAELIYLESLHLREMIYGKDNAEYVIVLDNLASNYISSSKFRLAEKSLLEANAIWLRLTGRESIDYAINCGNLARLYAKTGQPANADSLFREMIAVTKKIMGSDFPQLISFLQDYAEFSEKQKMFLQTDLLIREADSLMMKKLVQSVSFMSEEQLTNYHNGYLENYFLLLSYIFERIQHGVSETTLSSIAFNSTLLQKGFILNAIRKINNFVRSSPELMQLSTEYVQYRTDLAQEYSKPLEARKNVSVLQDQVSNMEKKMARSVKGYDQKTRQFRWEDIRNELKADEAVIEFVHFGKVFPEQLQSTYYAAFLLTKSSSFPKFIFLFEQKSLDSLLQGGGERRADYVNQLYSLTDRGAVSLNASVGTLYDIIWKPLEPELKGIRRIFYAASGSLHRINFDAIPVSGELTLADKYLLIRLGSSRQMVDRDSQEISHHSAVLLGNIKYGRDTTLSNTDTVQSHPKDQMAQVDNNRRSGTAWLPLPGTLKEINQIGSVLKSENISVEIRQASEATEDFVKKHFQSIHKSPRIVHFATHGFFFQDVNTDLKKDARTQPNDPVFKNSDQPMMRSGLILSGANEAWVADHVPASGAEDGILTAYEISQLNFSNTELVVLSACETGLGDILGNEGVYGLQRAFKIAGAKYLIMSLWQVPDKQTSMLMTTFYKKWLEAEGPDNGGNKMSIPDAFHAAQRELRELGFDPYQWAGFVLVE